MDYFCGIFKKGPSLTSALLRDRQEGQYALSYADCFAVATAIKEKATVVTGDPEFRKEDRLFPGEAASGLSCFCSFHGIFSRRTRINPGDE